MDPGEAGGWTYGQPTIGLLDFAVLGGSAAFLAYRITRPWSWPARGMNWGVAAGATLLIMGFAFQRFVPEFARYRSIHANAADLSRMADGTQLPVVYFQWQCDGCSFYLPADQVRRFADNDFAALQRFVLAHPRMVLVADAPHIALVQNALGERVSLTCSRGARGRLYLLSTRPASDMLAGPRPAAPVQRSRAPASRCRSVLPPARGTCGAFPAAA